MNFNFKNWTPPPRTPEGCGNRRCQKCYPLPWFRVELVRVERTTYEAIVQAPTAEAAVTSVKGHYEADHREILESTVPVAAPLAKLPEDHFICWFEQPPGSSLGWKPGDLKSMMGSIRRWKEQGVKLPDHILQYDEDVPENRERLERECEEEDIWLASGENY